MDGSTVAARRLPVGAEPGPGGTHVRVWAPGHERVTLVRGQGREVPLDPEGGGRHAAWVPGLGPGDDYGFRLGDEDRVRPDPASRWQPEGPDGLSRVVDPGAFAWTDDGWPGLTLPGQVLYEMHVGSFTPEGTWAAAAAELPRLRDLGVTAVELLPVAEFPGRFGWGYDPAALFAPFHRYGPPDALRAFVDRAHALGLGVILDVVYNHLAPEGAHVTAFAPPVLSESESEWGRRLNFDGPGSEGTREIVLASAAHWIAEYHLDGFRVDATQDVRDASPEHILTALARTAREAAGRRPILVIAETEPQDVRLIRPPSAGGHGFDAAWSEDFHHAALVAATGERTAYLADYRGTPQELLSALRRGWLFQGQWNPRQGKRRGTPALDQPPMRFVSYLENHDQVANALGARLRHRMSPARLRAVTAMQLLGPATPLLFQGQEWATAVPFLYVNDPPEARRAEVRDGRREQMDQFQTLADPALDARFPDPTDPATAGRMALRPAGTEEEAQALALHRDLLRLRREDRVVAAQGAGGLDGAVLGPEAFVLRAFGEGGDDRLLVVNLGADLELPGPTEPLLAPPEGRDWRLLWSSEHPAYGGRGTRPVEIGGAWVLPGAATVLMASGPG